MDIYDMECSKPSPTQPRSIPLPFLERTEHAALRDAVSTYSRCLTFSIRMDQIGEEIYIGEEKSIYDGGKCFEFFSRNFASLYDGGRDMTNVDDNCCAVKLSFIERYRVSRKGIFFSIRLLFDPFTPVQSAKPMTRTDVKASPRIPPPRVEFILFKK